MPKLKQRQERRAREAHAAAMKAAAAAGQEVRAFSLLVPSFQTKPVTLLFATPIRSHPPTTLSLPPVRAVRLPISHIPHTDMTCTQKCLPFAANGTSRTFCVSFLFDRQRHAGSVMRGVKSSRKDRRVSLLLTVRRNRTPPTHTSANLETVMRAPGRFDSHTVVSIHIAWNISFTSMPP